LVFVTKLTAVFQAMWDSTPGNPASSNRWSCRRCNPYRNKRESIENASTLRV
jgi:hypothetical protein